MRILLYRSEKTRQYFNSLIYDENYKQLIKYTKQTPGYVLRAKQQIFTYYQGVDKKYVITFMTPSGTTPGLFYFQKIELVDMPSLIKKYKNIKKPLQIVRMALEARLKVSCTDPDGEDEPSWLYQGFKYKATQSGYNFGKGEDRFPGIRNPKLRGGLCKHLRAVMSVLTFHAGVLTRDLRKLGVFD